MISDTIKERLSAYRIGEKLRRLRLKKSMGLVQLSEHTGLSPAMLSKLERDKLVPTLPTLMRIAMVFSVELNWFFASDEEPPCAVTRKADRLLLPNDPRERQVSYRFESLDFPVNARRMSAYYAEFEPTPSKGAARHSHPGAELIYVIRGRMILSFEGHEVTLRAGDSAYFDSATPHSYAREGQGPCGAVVVALDPS